MFALVSALSLAAQVQVFPTPTSLRIQDGWVSLASGLRPEFPSIPNPDRIRSLLREILPTRPPSKKALPIRFSLDSAVPGGAEAYRLRIDSQGIVATAVSESGLIWSIQTLKQLIRGNSAPKIDIQDAPKVSWRGVLLDEGRHFMGEATVKQFLDVMSLYKLNVLHWHLTEDQGWRIEIKKYPGLTGTGAWRVEADGRRYGGFYTQPEIRRIVKYARDRGITVVPEIELPGHCTSALGAYPQLGCRKAQIPVPAAWGVFTDVYCAGRETTFQFLEDVLSEVIPLFESPYFHIGGDEVPKTQWKACADCQARIKSEGLKDEHELQSWFVLQVQRFLARNGKTLIGWDEIIDGGLAPGAVVQVWQDIGRAHLAAKTKNPVVLSPSSHTYLNRPAEDLKMRTVYEQELVPEGLDPKLVLGHEVTLWSENITPNNLFERFLPRGIAAAEIFWSDPKRNWGAFEGRVKAHLPWLDSQGIAYGPSDRAISVIRLVPSLRPQSARIEVKTGMPNTLVRATTDGSAPTSRSAVIADALVFPIGKTIRARAFRGAKPLDDETVFRTSSHLAQGKPITLSRPPARRYLNAGLRGLTDGVLGSSNFDDGIWLGWQGCDLVATVDLGKVASIRGVSLGCLQQVGSWIVLPRRVRFSVSLDGSEWQDLGSVASPLSDRDFGANVFQFRIVRRARARFVRVSAESYGKLPSWHLGAGGDSWIFADELVVR